MSIRALSNTSVQLPIDGRWIIEVETRDDDGYLTTGSPSVTVTLPAGSTTTPTFEETVTGRFRAAYVVGTAGRYVARVVDAGHGAVDFAAFVTATTAGTGMPTVADYRSYDVDDGGSWTDAEIQESLDAEAAAQRAVCRVKAVYPADLRQALFRRVQRNLAMREVGIDNQGGDSEGGPPILPARDPEVRRLEGPHRKLVIG